MAAASSLLRAPTARPLFEELEQRLLYSADFAPGALAGIDAVDQRMLDDAREGEVTQAGTEIVFIDERVADGNPLIPELDARGEAGRPIEIMRIASDEDGIARISETLADRDGIDAAHLIGLGSDGVLQLGTARLDESTVLARAAELAGWGAALSNDAGLWLHGAATASASGQLVANLAALTGADVTATDSSTGALALEDATVAAGASPTSAEMGRAEPTTRLESAIPTSESRLPGQLAEEHRREIVFVDDSVGDVQTLVGGILGGRDAGPEIEVIRLTAGSDGLQQIGEALAARSAIDAIHIVSHGGAGMLLLGDAAIDAGTLLERAGEVRGWSSALTEGADILIYGCDVAGSDEGAEFVAALSRLTGADVAASDDATGNRMLGGDWELEASVGHVETVVVFGDAFRAQWLGLLPTYQQFGSFPNESEIQSDQSWGQTFQHDSGAGTYRVDQVSLALRRDADAKPQTITVTLRDSWNGAILGTASVASSSLGTGLSWVDFTFAGVDLTDDQSYTIGVTSSTKDGKVYAGFDSSGNYANGTRLDKSGSSLAGEDMAFRVSLVGSTQIAASQDTYIRLKPPDTTNNFGASTQLVVDRESGDLHRALLQFDLSAIPSNATITSATLTMQATQIGGSLNISVYEMQQAWLEGTANGTAGAANWNQSAAGTSWASAGGNFNATAVATLDTDTTGLHTWSLTNLVQAWVDGSRTNNGVMVASPDGGGNRTATYDSSEGTAPPRLIITYTVPPNSAPTLDTARSPALAGQSEDAGAPSGAVGTLVSALVDFASPAGQLDNVADANAGAQLGIAVTAVSTTSGSWHYSANGGADWNPLGAVSGSSARLLAADASTRLYFQPNANYNGTQAAAVTFRAWDQTTGTNGGTADTGAGGGSSAFSIAIDTAGLTVSAVNDAPVIANLAGDSLAYAEGSGASVIEGGNATVTDVDSTDLGSGTLTVSFTGGSDSTEDVLAIRNVGMGAGQIGVSGSNVTFGGTVIGSVAGGSGGTSLVVTFNTSSTPAAAQALVRNITYANADVDDPTIGVRSVRFVLTDGDGASSGGHVATVSVSAVNDAPVITSNGGGTNAAVSILENTTAVTTVASSDVDGGGLVYSISGGADAARFAIDGTSGVLRFVAAQDREAPTDADADSTYEVVVRVSDGLGGSDTQAISATVIDVDEFDVGPISDSNATADAVAENSPNGTIVGVTAMASDADATNSSIAYTLTSDAGGRFAIDGATGIITVANGSLLDAETSTSHGLSVRATSADGSTSTRAFTIAVTPVNDNTPVISSDGGGASASISRAENGTAVTTVSATDADAGAILTYAIAGGADAGRFAIDASTGVLTFVTAPDYEVADGRWRRQRLRRPGLGLGRFADRHAEPGGERDQRQRQRPGHHQQWRRRQCQHQREPRTGLR